MAKAPQKRTSGKQAKIGATARVAARIRVGQGGARRAPEKAPRGGGTVRREFGRDS